MTAAAVNGHQVAVAAITAAYADWRAVDGAEDVLRPVNDLLADLDVDGLRTALWFVIDVLVTTIDGLSRDVDEFVVALGLHAARKGEPDFIEDAAGRHGVNVTNRIEGGEGPTPCDPMTHLRRPPEDPR